MNNIKTRYTGAEKSFKEVKDQIRERFGSQLAEEYDPYTNCMTLKQWEGFGYRVKPGEKALRSVIVVEKKNDKGEVISTYPKTIHLFYYPQVKLKNPYGNNHQIRSCSR